MRSMKLEKEMALVRALAILFERYESANDSDSSLITTVHYSLGNVRDDMKQYILGYTGKDITLIHVDIPGSICCMRSEEFSLEDMAELLTAIIKRHKRNAKRMFQERRH